MLIDDLIQLPEQFKSGFRGIMLLHRSKDGAEGNPHRTCRKFISTHAQEFDEIVNKLNELRLQKYPQHRIYSTVNPRDMKKAIREFKRRQLDVDYDQSEINNRFYIDIENRFFSCFMNPSCKAESNFLFDCDTIKEYCETKLILEENVKTSLFEYKTRNGWHIITPPFDPTRFHFDVEIKKDDLIAIA